MLEAIWNILLELAPWLLIGVAIAGALHVLLPDDFLRRHLSGRWGVLKAAALGVPLPLCSCSVIPLGLSLRQQGASRGAVLAFLISTPQTGVDSIMVSAGMLGLPFALFKMASAFLIGLAGGVVADALVEPDSRAGLALPIYEAPRRTSRWTRFSEHALMLLRTIWRWMAIGVVVSAAITYFLPADALARLGAGGGLWAMLLALVVGMPLYVCAIASVPVAAALVHGGLPASAALVFLIAGPATNVATMGAVYRGLGRRAFTAYMATIAVGSLLAGWMFQSVLQLESLHRLGHDHGGHHAATPWAVGSAVALVLLLAGFAVDDLRRGLPSLARGRRSAPPSAAQARIAESFPIEVGVSGMTCQNCVSRLQHTLSRAEGVSAVSVSLHPGRAVVQGDITRQRVQEIIEGAGFQAV